jgi:hypothetical protein
VPERDVGESPLPQARRRIPAAIAVPRKHAREPRRGVNSVWNYINGGWVNAGSNLLGYITVASIFGLLWH